MAYVSEKGAAFVDRALYLPREEWADDPVRREEAGVPDEVCFATKGELAKEMLGRAFEAKVPARWVVADTVYGTARGLRGWLEGRGRPYVLAVPAAKGVYHGGRQRQARSLARDLPDEAWARASAGKGSKGERFYDWALVSLPDPEAPSAGRWLLVRRGIGDPTELAYYLAYGPKETPAEELVRVAGRRWAIEDCFEQAKGEVGLDEYEVRKWEAWHRHVTLSLLAHAYLAVLRSAAHDTREPEAKRGSSWPRADPAHRCGGAPPHPGGGGSRRRAGVTAGMVAVAPCPSGGCQALPRREAQPSSAETARRRATRARDNGDAAARAAADALPPHRRPVGPHRGVAAPKRGPW